MSNSDDQVAIRLMALFEPQLVAVLGLDISKGEARSAAIALEQPALQLRLDYKLCSRPILPGESTAAHQAEVVTRVVLPGT